MSDKPSGEIILYPSADGSAALEVRLDGDTVWLSQQQLSDLFQTSRTNVIEHIQNIYSEGELVEMATCRDFRQVRLEGAQPLAVLHLEGLEETRTETEEPDPFGS